MAENSDAKLATEKAKLDSSKPQPLVESHVTTTQGAKSTSPVTSTVQPPLDEPPIIGETVGEKETREKRNADRQAQFRRGLSVK